MSKKELGRIERAFFDLVYASELCYRTKDGKFTYSKDFHRGVLFVGNAILGRGKNEGFENPEIQSGLRMEECENLFAQLEKEAENEHEKSD